MIETEAQVKEWGRSVGVIIPKDAVVKERLRVGDIVKLLVKKKRNPIKETFGILKFKRATKDILKEVNAEGWNE